MSGGEADYLIGESKPTTIAGRKGLIQPGVYAMHVQRWMTTCSSV
jgi:hypothetical protein